MDRGKIEARIAELRQMLVDAGQLKEFYHNRIMALTGAIEDAEFWLKTLAEEAPEV